jgi:hypothetical protein
MHPVQSLFSVSRTILLLAAAFYLPAVFFHLQISLLPDLSSDLPSRHLPCDLRQGTVITQFISQQYSIVCIFSRKILNTGSPAPQFPAVNHNKGTRDKGWNFGSRKSCAFSGWASCDPAAGQFRRSPPPCGRWENLPFFHLQGKNRTDGASNGREINLGWLFDCQTQITNGFSDMPCFLI